MKLSGVLAFIALLIAVVAIYTSNNQAKTIDNTPIFTPKTVEKEDVEIADYMQFLLPYHEKLHWSIEAGNNDLIKFYVTELGEKMLEVVKADVWHEGRNLSEDMKTYGLKPLANLRDVLDDPIKAEERYTNLTEGCNSCHQQHKVQFITIKKPEQNRFSNQEFTQPAK